MTCESRDVNMSERWWRALDGVHSGVVAGGGAGAAGLGAGGAERGTDRDEERGPGAGPRTKGTGVGFVLLQRFGWRGAMWRVGNGAGKGEGETRALVCWSVDDEDGDRDFFRAAWLPVSIA